MSRFAEFEARLDAFQGAQSYVSRSELSSVRRAVRLESATALLSV